MSTPDCSQTFDPNKLVREGTSQDQRQLPALKDDYIKVDEHQPADWIVFAQFFAEFIHYIEMDNSIGDKDWRTFFNQDLSAVLAVAAIEKVDYLKGNITQYFKSMRVQGTSEPELKQSLGNAFNVLGALARQLDVLKEALPNNIALKNVLQNTIQSELAIAFERLIAYQLGASEAKLVDYSASYNGMILGGKVTPFPDLHTSHNFSPDWFKHAQAVDWASFHAKIKADKKIFAIESTEENGNPVEIELLPNLAEKLNYAANHNLFTHIFDLFIKAYSRTVSEAQKALQTTLTDKNDHAPHYALFLTFLRLLEFARDHANTLTKRHLDFYYKEVLKLKEKPDEPNSAHLTFQLAKHKQEHLLMAGMTLEAGKDSKDVDVVYELTDDIVVNTAKISELKTIARRNDRKIVAYPVANSQDGHGGEWITPLQQWHPYVRQLDKSKDYAEIGFAIGSHYLLLREGRRLVRLNLTFNRPVNPIVVNQSFEFYLTGPDGWVPVKPLQIAAQSNFNEESPLFTRSPSETTNVTIVFQISGDMPAIVPLQPDIHGNRLPQGLPTLKGLLNQEQTTTETMEQLQDCILVPDNCSIDVAVGYNKFGDSAPDPIGSGIKTLNLNHKFGEIKPDKPFQPFGTMPEQGDYLIIGADEALQKKNAAIQFRVVWKGRPNDAEIAGFDKIWSTLLTPKSSLEFLKDGGWNPANPELSAVDLFGGAQPGASIPSNTLKVPEKAVTDHHFDDSAYDLQKKNGFVRLVLLGDFGQKLYQTILSRHLIRLANKTFDENIVKDGIDKTLEKFSKDMAGKTSIDKSKFIETFSNFYPTEPYIPTIDSITLAYSANVKFTDQDCCFHSILPFGYRTVTTRPSRLQTLAQPLSLMGGTLRSSEYRLSPKFDNAGEFYLGLRDLNPPRTLSILFQVAEGSADPTVEKPPRHIQWSYLSDNLWVNFKPTEISDATGQLIKSGIIRFDVPRNTTEGDSLFLTPETCWLRAAVVESPNTVCRLMAVNPQAAKVTFKDQGNADDFLSKDLAGGKITKLIIPDAAIKKVEHPFPSFGGRPVESDERFYTRISERLRHKNRAITLWDYERLVLERFPNIYKVKCLNHMRLETGSDCNRIHNELAPGHVTLVTIPKLNHLNAIDPLRPYTSLGDLKLIKQFLEQHVSRFVKLHVHNPLFEEVRTAFRVKLHPGKDESFFTQKLREELVRFLSPWAFSDSQGLDFGGKIYKSALINFVENRDYVDYVTDFRLYHLIPGSNPCDTTTTESPDQEEVIASTAISILVSTARENHVIDPIPESETTVQGQFCSC